MPTESATYRGLAALLAVKSRLPLKADPGRASLESIQEELAKLKLLRAVALPNDLFAGIAPQVLRAYRHRVAVEEAYELRRHPDALRVTMLAAFCAMRGPEILDDLVDLLVATVHRIESRAERKVERQLLDDFKRVAGKDSPLPSRCPPHLGLPFRRPFNLALGFSGPTPVRSRSYEQAAPS